MAPCRLRFDTQLVKYMGKSVITDVITNMVKCYIGCNILCFMCNAIKAEVLGFKQFFSKIVIGL